MSGGSMMAGGCCLCNRPADPSEGMFRHQSPTASLNEPAPYNSHSGSVAGATLSGAMVSGVTRYGNLACSANRQIVNPDYIAALSVPANSHLGIQTPDAVTVDFTIAVWGGFVFNPAYYADESIKLLSAYLTINGVQAGSAVTLNRDWSEMSGGAGENPNMGFVSDNGYAQAGWFSTSFDLPCDQPIGPGDNVGYAYQLLYKMHPSADHPDEDYPLDLLRVSGGRIPFPSSDVFKAPSGTLSWAINGNKYVKFNPLRHTWKLTFSGGTWRPYAGEDVFKMEAGANWAAPNLQTGSASILQTVSDDSPGSGLERYKTIELNWSNERVWIRIDFEDGGFPSIYYEPVDSGDYASVLDALEDFHAGGVLFPGWSMPGVFATSGSTVFKPFLKTGFGDPVRLYDGNLASQINGLPTRITVERVKQ